MKFRLDQLRLLALVLLSVSMVPAAAAQRSANYAELQGLVVLDNPHVLVERFMLQPGQSTGRHIYTGAQLLVFVKGGVLRSRGTGRSTLWKDGRVVWRNAADPADEGSENAGTTPIVMIWVTVKAAVRAPSPAARGDKAKDEYLNYPNIPGEDLLENERVIVQRFLIIPGQWEGVHAHHPNMLYVHVKGGHWATRSNKEREHAYPEPSADGKVGWMPTIDISEGHESGNIGKEPIDLIWVTLKD